MLGINSFVIVFKDNRHEYKDADTIQGHVLIDFSEPKKATSKFEQ